MYREYPPMPTKEKNLLIFREETRENGRVKELTGKLAFNRVLMVQITVPGEKSIPEYEVDIEFPEGYPDPVHGKVKKNPAMYARFGEYIEKFKQTQASGGAISGTPIEEWPAVNIRHAALMKSVGVYTVEALADLSDSALQSIGLGGQALRQKAKDYLAAAEKTAGDMRLQEMNRKQEQQMALLQEQINALSDAMASLPLDAQAHVKSELGKRGGKRQAA